MLGVSVATNPDSGGRSAVVDLNILSPRPTHDLLRRMLSGMVARGLGVEALCAYLSLARTALLDLIVELDLPTPPDRPLRKPGGRNPWTLADTTLFVVLWMAGWHAESLGERFGRSAGACRSKAHRLGLPRRDRKLVFRPAQPGRDLLGGVLQGFRPEPAQAEPDQACPAESDKDAPTRADETGAGSHTSTLARGVPAPATDTAIVFPLFPSLTADLFAPTPVGTPPRRKPKWRWTRARDRELGQRWWARQHYRAIARDMGISPSAVQSRAARLELPTLNDEKNLFLFRREELVDHFDPNVIEAHVAAADYVERKCSCFASEGKEFWFWSKRSQSKFTSDEFKRLEGKKTARFKPLPPPVRPCDRAMHAW